MRRSLRDALIISFIWLPLVGWVWTISIGWEKPAAAIASIPTRVPDVWVLKKVTATPVPSPTNAPTPITRATPSPTTITQSLTQPTIVPSASPTSPSVGLTVNGLPISEFVVFTPETAAHIQALYELGRAFGRNPHHVSRLGDSTIMKPRLLGYFDAEPYNLGDYNYLQPALNHYAGSLDENGLATRVGLHAWNIFDPFWADKNWCEPNETLIACEIRVNQPSVIFIRLGSNDSGVPDSFELGVRELVEFCLAQGVIPIIGTKADRFEGADNINNEILRQIAADYDVPLWDYDLVAATLPNRGLDPRDNIHIMPTYRPHDFTQAEAFTTGHTMQDLTALMALDAVWRLLPQQ